MVAVGLAVALWSAPALAAVPAATPSADRAKLSVPQMPAPPKPLPQSSSPPKPVAQPRLAPTQRPATLARPGTPIIPAAGGKLPSRRAASPRIGEGVAPIAFALVKGPADACGPGCDSWIAAEGKIDNDAAARFRKFMKLVGDRKLPIYFNSPGGNLQQALALGNMLRERKAVVRVGRTTVRECGFEPQEGDVCTRLKLSGRELHGEVWTRGAICNSACPYVILAAPTREIAADATLAVHSPRVILNFTGGVPTREMRAQAMQQAMARADKMVLDYIVKLGADPGLLTVARSVPFESMRILTREEIVRFALDRRQRVESPWMFETASRGIAYKTILARKDGEGPFQTTRIQLVCFDQDRFELDVERSAPAGSSGLLALASGGIRLNFLSPPRRSGDRETWGVFLNASQVKTLAAMPAAELSDAVLNVARPNLATFAVSSEGLPNAVKMLTESCPPPKVVARSSGSPVSPQASAAPSAPAR
ncbi:hypothetical protein ACQR0Z_25760 [Bradyrhizobium sp. HKCCYLS3077]|uniref:hypothetical protein n=1 Tax=Bradyrhizobium sp. HKCCYLS3077 TaxID=3420761 RepID=UPI003EB8EDE6